MNGDVFYKVGGAAVAAFLGIVTGWAANALTLGGRVGAIEAGQLRIELLLHSVLHAKLSTTTIQIPTTNIQAPNAPK